VGRKFNYNRKELAAALFGQDGISPDMQKDEYDLLFGFNDSLKNLYPIEKLQ